jgi:hypothetical protein
MGRKIIDDFLFLEHEWDEERESVGERERGRYDNIMGISSIYSAAAAAMCVC